MKTLHVLGAWLLLLALSAGTLIACGGDDDDGGTAPTAEDSGDSSGGEDDDGDGSDGGEDSDDGDDGSAGEDDDAGDDGDDDGDGFDFGAGVARITIGDTTYEFDLTTGFVVCRDVFGIIQAGGPSADDEDIEFSAAIPPVDWETFDDGRYDPPSIVVETNDEKWVADPGRSDTFANFPPESMVNSYDKDGLAASGTATFIDEFAIQRGDSIELIEGSFEIACVEE